MAIITKDNKNQVNLISGMLFLIVPLYGFLTWIYVYNTNPNHPARVEDYKKFFWGIFQGPLLPGMLNITCAALAIAFLSRVHNLNTPAALLKYALIVISCFLIMFNLWSLM